MVNADASLFLKRCGGYMFDLLDLKVKLTKTGIAKLVTRYHDLIINCELVLYTKETPHLWIRMPEIWVQGKKVVFCGWPNKDISNAFQISILQKVKDKYGLDVVACQKIHAALCKQVCKKSFITDKEVITPAEAGAKL